jgi:hypothetical protein
MAKTFSGTGPVGITDHVQADNANDVSAGEARDAANAVVAELENDNSGPAPTVLDLDDLVHVWTFPEEPVVWSMAFDHMELPSTESAAPVQAALDPASILHLEPDPDFDWTEELDLNLDLGEDIVVSAEEDISGNAPGSSTSGVGGDESASVFVPEVDHADLSTGKKRKRAERVHTGRKRQRRK